MIVLEFTGGLPHDLAERLEVAEAFAALTENVQASKHLYMASLALAELRNMNGKDNAMVDCTMFFNMLPAKANVPSAEVLFDRMMRIAELPAPVRITDDGHVYMVAIHDPDSNGEVFCDYPLPEKVRTKIAEHKLTHGKPANHRAV